MSSAASWHILPETSFAWQSGGAWLAGLIGAEKGWLFGVAPFILGGFLKAALAAAVLKGLKIYGGKRA